MINSRFSGNRRSSNGLFQGGIFLIVFAVLIPGIFAEHLGGPMLAGAGIPWLQTLYRYVVSTPMSFYLIGFQQRITSSEYRIWTAVAIAYSQ